MTMLLLLPACVPAVWAEPVRVRELRHCTTIRAVAFARESKRIATQLDQASVAWCVPSGSYVNEGDPVARLQFTTLEEDTGQIPVMEAQMAQEQLEIRNTQMAMSNKLEELKGQIAVLETRMERYKSMPDTNRVHIAHRRVEVARLKADATAQDLANARERFENHMISPDELDHYRLLNDQQAASLEHAAAYLAYVSEPASPLLKKKTRLEITNTLMEIDRLTNAVVDYGAIARIKREASEAAIASKRQWEEELDERHELATVRAPASGIVVHTQGFRDRLMTGGFVWRNFNIMTMPDTNAIAFKAVLPAEQRTFFRIGDRALLELGDTIVTGKLASVSEMPRDQAEQERQGWGDKKEYGIKVYDLVIEPGDRPPGLVMGMNADCCLTSSNTVSGPSVPLSLVVRRDDIYELAIDGQVTEVTGTPVGDYLLLDDASLVGKEATSAVPSRRKVDGSGAAGVQSEYVTASGDLRPVHQVDVFVGRTHMWPRIAWLIEEDTVVKQGDEIVRLETKDTEKGLQRRESQLREALGSLASLEEQAALDRKTRGAELAMARNRLEIARIDLVLTENTRDEEAILERRLALARLQASLRRLDRQIDRKHKYPDQTAAKVELDRLNTERRRSNLEAEKLQLQLRQLLQGPAPLSVRRERLEYVKQGAEVDTLARQHETRTALDQSNIETAIAQAKEARRGLASAQENLSNTVVRATADGLLRYGRVWSPEGFVKVAVGREAGFRCRVASLVDAADMYVRVEIPERYFSQATPGTRVAVEVPSLTAERLGGTVTQVEYAFEQKVRQELDTSLYSNSEPLGETVFFARIDLERKEGVSLKPGAVAHVIFPFRQ